MDLTTAVNSLGSDYVNKVSDLLTNKTNTASGTTDDSSFDSVFNAVSGLLDSTNSYIQQAQQAEVDYALGNMTNTHELGVYQQKANHVRFTIFSLSRILSYSSEVIPGL